MMRDIRPLPRRALSLVPGYLPVGGLVTLLTVLVVFAAVPAHAAAEVLCVDWASGPIDPFCANGYVYPTLAAALAVASDGDDVRIAVGTYSEALTLTHALTLTGGYAGGFATSVSPTGTLLDGGNSPALTVVFS